MSGHSGNRDLVAILSRAPGPNLFLFELLGLLGAYYPPKTDQSGWELSKISTIDEKVRIANREPDDMIREILERVRALDGPGRNTLRLSDIRYGLRHLPTESQEHIESAISKKIINMVNHGFLEATEELAETGDTDLGLGRRGA